MVTKDHMKKYQKEYRQFLAEIGPQAFKRPLLTHRNAFTTGWKRVGRVSRDNTKERIDTGGGLGEERELEPA